MGYVAEFSESRFASIVEEQAVPGDQYAGDGDFVGLCDDGLPAGGV